MSRKIDSASKRNMKRPIPFIARLKGIVEEVSSEPDPSKALEALLARTIDALPAAHGGRLYKLDLAKASYECICQIDAPGAPPIDAHILNGKSQLTSPVEHVIVNRTQLTAPTLPTDRNSMWSVLVPVTRGKACLGIIDIIIQDPAYVSEEEQQFVAALAPTILFLFERGRTLKLLRAEQQPVDFHQPFRDFITDLTLLVADASGMPYIALSELVEDDLLECKAQFGLSDNVDLRTLDVPQASTVRPFDEVLQHRKPYAFSGAGATEQVDLAGPLAVFPDVHAFVLVPVARGDVIFGTVWFGLRNKYELDVLEVTELENVADGLAVSIANYTNFHRRQEDLLESIKISTTITAVEVAQAARHEARSHIDSAQNRLALLESVASDPSRTNVQRLSAITHQLGENLRDIAISLDKIKSITKPPIREKTMCALNEVWNNAFQIVDSRLNYEHIEYRITGPTVTIPVYQDFLLHAFLNLILNSIDAFRASAKKRNRLITVTIDDPSDSAHSVEIRYADNATGIDPSQLGPRDDGEDLLSVDSVFKPGVTSKKDGSGFGLYLVRNILKEHGGSIDLKSHRGGVVFDILLPKS